MPNAPVHLTERGIGQSTNGGSHLSAAVRCRRTVRRCTVTKSPSANRSRFVFRRWQEALDEIEQTLTTGCDSAVVHFSTPMIAELWRYADFRVPI